MFNKNVLKQQNAFIIIIIQPIRIRYNFFPVSPSIFKHFKPAIALKIQLKRQSAAITTTAMTRVNFYTVTACNRVIMGIINNLFSSLLPAFIGNGNYISAHSAQLNH